jgi:ribosome-associated translation inhibitor RaiA
MTARIRTAGVELSREDRDYIRQKIDRKVARFTSPIEGVSFRLADVNGPRGGVDKVCRAKVVVSGLPSVVVERRHQSARAAVEGTLDAAERAVRKIIRRRQTAPRRGAVRSGRARGVR